MNISEEGGRPVDVLLAVLEVDPAVFLHVLEVLVDEVSHLDVAVEELAIVAEEDGLRFAEVFIPILQDVVLDLVELGEQLLVLGHQEPALGRMVLAVGQLG